MTFMLPLDLVDAAQRPMQELVENANDLFAECQQPPNAAGDVQAR
jgi:hypothetical protein